MATSALKRTERIMPLSYVPIEAFTFTASENVYQGAPVAVDDNDAQTVARGAGTEYLGIALDDATEKHTLRVMTYGIIPSPLASHTGFESGDSIFVTSSWTDTDDNIFTNIGSDSVTYVGKLMKWRTVNSIEWFLLVSQTGLTASDNPTAPQLLSVSPTSGSTGNLVNTNLVLTFDRTLTLQTNELRIYDASDTLIQTLDNTDAALSTTTVSNDTVTVTLDSNLSIATTYYVLLDEDFVQDANGNSNGAITSTGQWTFAT